MVLVLTIPVKPLPFLSSSFVGRKSENVGFSSLGMMTNILASTEKTYPRQ